MIELIIAVCTVIFVSATCSLAEAVLYAVPVSYVESLAQKGTVSGRILKDLRMRKVDRPISAILSLNTIANTGGAFLAGTAFIKVFGAQWEHYFTMFITLSVLLLSEVIPKTIGVVYSRSLAGPIAIPLRFLVWIMYPFVVTCRLVTRAFSKGGTTHEVSEEEIASMARMGRESGAIEPHEARVMQNILSLKRKTARDVMTPRTVVFALSADLTVEQAQKEAGTWQHSRVPVYEEGFEDVIGVVMRRDAFNALTKGQGQKRLSELMHPVHFVAETVALDRVLQMFLERRQHLFAVIDEYSGLTGVLTLEDVLEEILGREIVDESDTVTDMRELARRRRRQVSEGE